MIENEQYANPKRIFQSRFADAKRPTMAEIVSAGRVSSLIGGLTHKGPIRTGDIMRTAAGIVDGTIKTDSELVRSAAAKLMPSRIAGPIKFSEIQAAAREVAKRKGVINPLSEPLLAPGEMAARMEDLRREHESRLVSRDYLRPLRFVPITRGPAESVFAVGSNRETDREN